MNISPDLVTKGEHSNKSSSYLVSNSCHYCVMLMCAFFPLVLKEWSEFSGSHKNAQPSAGAEERGGDSPQNQSDVARSTEQTEGE